MLRQEKRPSVQTWSFPGAGLLLLLLGLDLGVIALHVVYKTIDNLMPGYTGILLNPALNLVHDGSLGELFQYAKEFGIAAMFLVLWLRTRRWVHLGWFATFGYLLLDDSLRFHEEIGKLFVTGLGLGPWHGLRAQDVGELMVTLVAASVLLSLIGIGYWLSDAAARAVTHRVLALLAAIAFFGVFIDAVDMWFTPTLLLGNLYALFEDGGEMLVMSVAAWYVYLVLAYSAPIPTPRIAQRQPLPHPSR